MWTMWLISIWLIAMSVADIKSRKVPVWLLAAGFGAVIVMQMENGQSVADIQRMIVGMLPGMLLVLLALVTKYVGYADGVVLAVLGIYVGLQKSVVILGISLFIASVLSVVLLLLRRVNAKTELAYLPFMTLAWMLVEVI